MVSEKFPDLEAISKRWLNCWAMTQSIIGNMPPDEKLDRALTVFFAEEIELDGAEHQAPVIIGAAMAGISQSKTHSKNALEEAVKRFGKKPTTTWMNRVDTRGKRIALLAFPFTTVATLWTLYYDINYEGGLLSLGFFIFGMLSALLLIFTFTRLGNWLSEGS